MVVYPSSTEDVVKIVNIARKYRMPVIPYSGATSLEGHTRAPTVGAICVDMSHMDKILEIHGAFSYLPTTSFELNSTVMQRQTRTSCASPGYDGWTSTTR